jgi:hypothetical protein
MKGCRNKDAAIPLAIAVVVAIMLPAAAQHSKKAAVSAAAKTTLIPELDQLRFYLGDWSYSETYEKSVLFPNGGQNSGSWTAQVGPQGRSIIHAFVSHGTGDNYEGIEVMTWDAKAKLYRDHSLWYDSPDQWSYIGRFDGDALVYRAEFELNGRHVTFRSETRPLQSGGFTLDEFASVDGKPEQKILRGVALPR